MRKRKFEWREKLPAGAYEELEVWTSVLLALAAALLLYAALTAQAARAAEFPSDVGAPTLLFQDASGSYSTAAPLETDLRMSVAGVVARVRVAQRFRNLGSTYLEAVYVLPLPDDAAVDRLSMKIGERVIEGEIHERAAAERIYGEARAAGQRASLVRQTSANLFTTAVANIAPGEQIDITIEYLQTARYDAGEFSLRVPMTFTPRYGASDTPEGQSAPTPDAVTTTSETAAGAQSTPRSEAYVHAVLSPGMPLEWLGSRTHELTSVHQQGPAWSVMRAAEKPANGAIDKGLFVHPKPADLYVLDTVAPRVPMDRDVVISWRPQVGPAPAITALTETVGDTTYALLMILPPAAAHSSNAGPREQIFVIDSSGSMAGQSMAQAKAALKNALERLNSGDLFNIVDFDSTTRKLYTVPTAFNSKTHA